MQAELASRGFRIAIGDLSAAATIGGAIACAANSPLRLLYGGLRDQLLACQVALPDGRLLRFGRPLVKDVAGYAMSKVMGGAFGTLGLLCEVTLKIWPLPAAQRSPDFHRRKPGRGAAPGRDRPGVSGDLLGRWL